MEHGEYYMLWDREWSSLTAEQKACFQYDGHSSKYGVVFVTPDWDAINELTEEEAPPLHYGYYQYSGNNGLRLYE